MDVTSFTSLIKVMGGTAADGDAIRSSQTTLTGACKHRPTAAFCKCAFLEARRVGGIDDKNPRRRRRRANFAFCPKFSGAPSNVKCEDYLHVFHIQAIITLICILSTKFISNLRVTWAAFCGLRRIASISLRRASKRRRISKRTGVKGG